MPYVVKTQSVPMLCDFQEARLLPEEGCLMLDLNLAHEGAILL